MVSARTSQDVRPPAFAGSFYPASAATLAAMVDGFLADARVPPGPPPKALVVPHAGYVYSGPIAGTAYACLRPIADRISRVVLVGPSHRTYLVGLASPGVRALHTPLGDVAVDLDALRAVPQVSVDPAAHAQEHSLEVQLPFLQRVVPHARVVPLVVGQATAAQVGAVIDALWGGDETVIVVSSDLSHYLPYDVGRAADRLTAQRVLALDAHLEGEDACGCVGLNGLAWAGHHHGLRARLLDLRSSGDTAGPRGEVVGYGAFAFYEGHDA